MEASPDEDSAKEDTPEKNQEGSEEEVEMIEEIAKSSLWDPEKILQLQPSDSTQEFLHRRMSRICDNNPEILTQFQNFVTKN